MLNINPWNMVMIVINLLVLYAFFVSSYIKPVMNVNSSERRIDSGTV